MVYWNDSENQKQFSYCLGVFSWSLELELTVGTLLSSRLIIAWVTSSLHVRPERPKGNRNINQSDSFSVQWRFKCCCQKDGGSPCTIRSLRTSCSLCSTGTETWYWTGSWWGAWHCPNKPSAQEDTTRWQRSGQTCRQRRTDVSVQRNCSWTLLAVGAFECLYLVSGSWVYTTLCVSVCFWQWHTEKCVWKTTYFPMGFMTVEEERDKKGWFNHFLKRLKANIHSPRGASDYNMLQAYTHQ